VSFNNTSGLSQRGQHVRLFARELVRYHVGRIRLLHGSGEICWICRMAWLADKHEDSFFSCGMNLDVFEFE
jgi:hypothetical protein